MLVLIIPSQDGGNDPPFPLPGRFIIDHVLERWLKGLPGHAISSLLEQACSEFYRRTVYPV